MPATTVSPGRAAARPAGRTAGRKSPLRVVTELQPLTIEEPPDLAEAGGRPELGRAPELTAAQLRRLMISEFRDWLRSRTNRNGAAVPGRHDLRLRQRGGRPGRLDDG